MTITNEQAQKNVRLVVKNNNDTIDKVVDLQNVQVGTTSSPKNLTVSGNLHAAQITGSMTQTVAGNSYIAAGSGMSVVSGSSGQILISAVSEHRGFEPSGLASFTSGASAAGNFTVGTQFYVFKTGVNCTGIRFYWAVASTKSVKMSLWDGSGVRIANITVSVSSTGIATATFSSPVALTVGTLYKVSAWQTDGTTYTRSVLATVNTFWPGGDTTKAIYCGGAFVIKNPSLFSAGDAVPTSTAASEVYMLEPILDY